MEADHEYEMLDKYDQADIGVEVPPPKIKSESMQMQMLLSAASGDYELTKCPAYVAMATSGDYKFTQCPAYVAVATTSIHGNTDKPE